MQLIVYDMMGREVAKLYEGMARAGFIQRSVFNADAVAGGVYFATLRHGGTVLTKKLGPTK